MHLCTSIPRVAVSGSVASDEEYRREREAEEEVEEVEEGEDGEEEDEEEEKDARAGWAVGRREKEEEEEGENDSVCSKNGSTRAEAARKEGDTELASGSWLLGVWFNAGRTTQLGHTEKLHMEQKSTKEPFVNLVLQSCLHPLQASKRELPSSS